MYAQVSTNFDSTGESTKKLDFLCSPGEMLVPAGLLNFCDKLDIRCRSVEEKFLDTAPGLLSPSVSQFSTPAGTTHTHKLTLYRRMHTISLSVMLSCATMYMYTVDFHGWQNAHGASLNLDNHNSNV